MVKFRYTKALLAFMGVIFLFLIFENIIIIREQQHFLKDRTRYNIRHEIQLMGDVSLEAVLKHDYVTVASYIELWGRKHEMYKKIKAIAPNGFVIAEYQRPVAEGVETFTESVNVQYSGNNLISIEIVSDYSEAEQTISMLWNRLLTGSILFACLLGASIWFLMQRMALLPLEKEIELRKKAEEDLLLIKEDLETMVAVRTSELKRELDERKKAEAIVFEREEHIRLLLNSTSEAIYGIDTKGVCTFCNPACLKMLGYTKEEELLGRNIHKLIHYKKNDGSDYPEEQCKIYEVYRTLKGIHDDEEVFWRADGKMINVEYWAHPVMRDNNIIGVVVNFLDISEKRKLEEQLLHSQKMEAVGLLAGGIAHDFNNLLTGILGYGELLKSAASDDKQVQTYIDQILYGGRRAEELVSSLLTFSRKQVFSLKPVNLNEIVTGIERLLLRVIGEDIQLNTVLAQRNLVAMVDAGQIEHVLMNLATNARDAMPEGGILSIETSVFYADESFSKTRLLAGPGEYACMTVSDNGLGMDENTRAKIFEPFFTTKDLGKGTGLGLSIVYGIIKQHNGYINIYSEPGEGTTFRIYLPIVDIEAATEEPQKKEYMRTGTETILIAEDELFVREMIMSSLETAGYKTIGAEDGDVAVRRFKERKDDIDLVMLDVIMPHKNGPEAYGEIIKIRPDIKVIFMSGYTGDAIHRRGLLDESLNFMSKPFTPATILKRVRDLLDD